MKNNAFGKFAAVVETLRKTFSNIIWIIIILVVLAGLGNYFLLHDMGRLINLHQTDEPVEKPIEPQIPWHEVDAAIVEALSRARLDTEKFAATRFDAWTAQLMQRVDNDFLNWYFSYWTQQQLGLESLWHHGVHHFLAYKPTAAEMMTEKIQEEFAKRVLRPQIAELEIERITRESINHYVKILRDNLDTIPGTYKIPPLEWERHLNGIALMTHAAEANRETPLTLKTLYMSGAAGTLVLLGKTQALLGQVSSKIIAKSAGKTASKIAAKTGGKVAAKAGGKFLGTIVGIGILIWDVWDHNKTTQENRPILRRALLDYFNELEDVLLYDSQYGMITTLNDLERRVVEQN